MLQSTFIHLPGVGPSRERALWEQGFSTNGSQFDVPFFRAHFPHARLDQAHIDLRFVLASLGYRGGSRSLKIGCGCTGMRQLKVWTAMKPFGSGTFTGEATRRHSRSLLVTT